MGTQETVAYWNPLPECGRRNSISRKPPFPTGGNVPIAVGGENRERPFAKKAEIAKAAIRYALVLFLLGLQ